MEEKLGAILNNPQMMQQIMSMAQSIGQSAPQQEPPKQTAPPPPSRPSLDMAGIQKMAGLAQSTGIDQNQQALLRALAPYISRERRTKLEKAMRAAKVARMASAFLNAGGLQMLSGR